MSCFPPLFIVFIGLYCNSLRGRSHRAVRHHPLTSPAVIVKKVVGHHLFMNIIPNNFMARTEQKVWCDRGMRAIKLCVKWQMGWSKPWTLLREFLQITLLVYIPLLISSESWKQKHYNSLKIEIVGQRREDTWFSDTPLSWSQWKCPAIIIGHKRSKC